MKSFSQKSKEKCCRLTSSCPQSAFPKLPCGVPQQLRLLLSSCCPRFWSQRLASHRQQVLQSCSIHFGEFNLTSCIKFKPCICRKHCADLICAYPLHWWWHPRVVSVLKKEEKITKGKKSRDLLSTPNQFLLVRSCRSFLYVIAVNSWAQEIRNLKSLHLTFKIWNLSIWNLSIWNRKLKFKWGCN